MKANELKMLLDARFEGAVRAVSWEGDFDFYAVYQLPPHSQPDDKTVVLLFPQPGKDFYLEVINVEDQADEIVLSTPDRRWSLRPLPAEHLSEYKAGMKRGGVESD